MLLQVGRENLVGTENGALLCMMRNLEIERVTLAAMGLGIARCEHVDTGSQRAARHVSFSAAANPVECCGNDACSYLSDLAPKAYRGLEGVETHRSTAAEN